MFSSLAKLLFNRAFFIYAVIGSTGVLIDFLLYIGLVNFGIPPFAASMVSVSAGIVNNFFWNAHFNFKKKDHLLARFASFYAVGATGVVLSALIIILLHNIIGMNDLVAKAISVPFIVIFQFWLNKNTSFADSKGQVPWKALAITGVMFSVIILFAINAPYFNFTDENDNLLGAQLIATDGAVIYKDYFSHHMPLMYFVAAPLLWLFGTNLLAVKVVFGLSMAIWLLVMSRHLLKKFGLVSFTLFTLLIALTQTLNWSHMVLAETFVAFALVHALILFLTRKNSGRNPKLEIITYCILGAIPALASLPYAPITALIYALCLFWLIESKYYRSPGNVFTLLVGGALPYVLLLTYFYVTHSFGEFREQALTFNTVYYSQFSADAPKTPLEGMLSIPRGAFDSLYRSLVDFRLPGQPITAIFSITLLASVLTLTAARKYLIAGVFSVALLGAASRGGFTEAFVNSETARIGTVVAFVGILLIVSVTSQQKAQNRKTITPNSQLIATFFTVSSGVLVTILVVASLANISNALVDYTQGKSMVTLKEEPGSPSTVVNIVNGPTDTYWLGPIDFSSQIIIKSSNVSSYRFYAPWHAVCPKCTSQLEKDLEDKNPDVIVFDKSVSVWNNKASIYAKPLLESFEDEYYQLSDIRLQQFYFRTDEKAEINMKLQKAGYDL